MSKTVFPCFQPIIEVASGEVAGYEALARRLDGQGNIESAADIFFNPLRTAAERLEADRSVRSQALKRFAAHNSTQFLSLNLSPEWIDSLASLDDLPTLAMIREAGLDASQVLLEITEVHGDISRIKTLSEHYCAIGVRIAYDDFGTGFQQLDRLLAFTPDMIKLDLKMFRDDTKSLKKETIIQMVGQMGTHLGSKIIVEGVETEDDFYLALHCDASYVQGYLFDPALPDFVAPDAFRPKVRQLLAEHLEMTVAQTTRRRLQTDGLCNDLIALRDLLAVGKVEAALRNYHPDPDLLRFYVCNRLGDQISPNYHFREGTWQIDESVTGCNWSWRPYFYQLIASSSDYDRRILRSAPYLDIDTGRRCITLSLALDSERVMLVDVEENGPFSAGISCYSAWVPEQS